MQEPDLDHMAPTLTCGCSNQGKFQLLESIMQIAKARARKHLMPG